VLYDSARRGFCNYCPARPIKQTAVNLGGVLLCGFSLRPCTLAVKAVVRKSNLTQKQEGAKTREAKLKHHP
jgi:hypothetical protein